jgi:hypothetical protein
MHKSIRGPLCMMDDFIDEVPLPDGFRHEHRKNKSLSYECLNYSIPCWCYQGMFSLIFEIDRVLG